jgi:hypothetical protein
MGACELPFKKSFIKNRKNESKSLLKKQRIRKAVNFTSFNLQVEVERDICTKWANGSVSMFPCFLFVFYVIMDQRKLVHLECHKKMKT